MVTLRLTDCLWNPGESPPEHTHGRSRRPGTCPSGAPSVTLANRSAKFDPITASPTAYTGGFEASEGGISLGRWLTTPGPCPWSATEMGRGRDKVLATAGLACPPCKLALQGGTPLEGGALSLRYAHLFWTKGKVPPVLEPQVL